MHTLGQIAIALLSLTTLFCVAYFAKLQMGRWFWQKDVLEPGSGAAANPGAPKPADPK